MCYIKLSRMMGLQISDSYHVIYFIRLEKNVKNKLTKQENIPYTYIQKDSALAHSSCYRKDYQLYSAVPADTIINRYPNTYTTQGYGPKKLYDIKSKNGLVGYGFIDHRPNKTGLCAGCHHLPPIKFQKPYRHNAPVLKSNLHDNYETIPNVFS